MSKIDYVTRLKKLKQKWKAYIADRSVAMLDHNKHLHCESLAKAIETSLTAAVPRSGFRTVEKVIQENRLEPTNIREGVKETQGYLLEKASELRDVADEFIKKVLQQAGSSIDVNKWFQELDNEINKFPGRAAFEQILDQGLALLFPEAQPSQQALQANLKAYFLKLYEITDNLARYPTNLNLATLGSTVEDIHLIHRTLAYLQDTSKLFANFSKNLRFDGMQDDVLKPFEQAFENTHSAVKKHLSGAHAFAKEQLAVVLKNNVLDVAKSDDVTEEDHAQLCIENFAHAFFNYDEDTKKAKPTSTLEVFTPSRGSLSTSDKKILYVILTACTGVVPGLLVGAALAAISRATTGSWNFFKPTSERLVSSVEEHAHSAPKLSSSGKPDQ